MKFRTVSVVKLTMYIRVANDCCLKPQRGLVRFSIFSSVSFVAVEMRQHVELIQDLFISVELDCTFCYWSETDMQLGAGGKRN